MAKLTVNPRRIISNLRSFKDFPLTAKEIKEIEDIQSNDYWKRGELKAEFCDRNNRLISEVNEYFKKNRRLPAKLTGKKSEPVVNIDSTPAPKEQVTEAAENPIRVTPTGEIRIKYKEVRIDGGELVFKV